MPDTPKYLIVLVGPTAVGKTAAAIELAKIYNTEIVSADSRQFYKEISIGTAKPSEAELNEVPHHFINTKSVTELYNVGQYEKDCIQLLEKLFTKHNVVILTGGTGMYINAVLYGVDEFPEVDSEIRERLNTQLDKDGLEALTKILLEKDPSYYNEVDVNNSQRVIRALEVIEQTGKPYSSFLKKKTVIRNFIPIKIGLELDREILYQRINRRVDNMIKEGLLEEVKSMTTHKNCNALKTVGYNELFDYLENKMTFEEAVSKIKQHTRNYAKRQLTWFKNQDDFKWFDPGNIEKIKLFIDSNIK
ncbi:MAG: tRNA (adenosine(37)-N6)-dimethylallyltransferase MiaA [Bacteroidia bacterium]